MQHPHEICDPKSLEPRPSDRTLQTHLTPLCQPNPPSPPDLAPIYSFTKVSPNSLALGLPPSSECLLNQ